MRQALLTTVLVLVIFTPRLRECQAGLWIEQGRYPPVSYEIVLVRTKMPTWLVRLKAVFSHWPVSPKIFARLLCQVLAFCLLVWLNILGWLIPQILTNPKIPMAGPIRGDFLFRRPVYGATLEVKMAISLMETVTQRAVIVEKAPLFEVKQLTTTTSINKIMVSQENYPLLALRADTSRAKQYLYEDNIIAEAQLCGQTTTLSQVDELQSHSSITKTSSKTKESDETVVEQAMINFYQTLNEKDRRRYAAVEAIKLGHGGQSVIAKMLGLSRKTIAKGIKEIKSGLVADKRIRKKGAGRKPYTHQHPSISEKFLDVLKHYTAGEPMKGEIRWTNLTRQEIAQRLDEKHEIKVSITVIKQLLKKHDFRRRQAQKRRTMKPVALRNEQFENIARLKEEYEAAGHPIISMDSKKKEHLGNYYRDGYLYTREEITTWDHDFISMAVWNPT